jgi:multidrug transporter EmrE-like cation transporter
LKTCSRCSILISDDSVLCPECEAALKKEHDEGTRKIAGIIAAVALYTDVLFTIIIILNDKTAFPVYSGVVSIGSGILCGSLLLSRNRKITDITRILIIITGIVLTMLISTGDTISGPLLRVLFTASLVSLITGIPEKVRFSVSTAGAAAFLLSTLILVQESFPAATISNTGSKTVHRQSSKKHKPKRKHRKAPRVSIPHRQWKKAEGKQAKEKHQKALQWLEYPEFDAEVFILQDSVTYPDTINQRVYLDSIITHARSTLTGFMVIDKAPVVTKTGLEGISVIAHGMRKGKGVFHQYALFTEQNYVYQIFCVSNEETFNEVKKDFSGMITSFKP